MYRNSESALVTSRMQRPHFALVKHQFETSWRHQTDVPDVRFLYKVVYDELANQTYKNYR